MCHTAGNMWSLKAFSPIIRNTFWHLSLAGRCSASKPSPQGNVGHEILTCQTGEMAGFLLRASRGLRRHLLGLPDGECQRESSKWENPQYPCAPLLRLSLKESKNIETMKNVWARHPTTMPSRGLHNPNGPNPCYVFRKKCRLISFKLQWDAGHIQNSDYARPTRYSTPVRMFSERSEAATRGVLEGSCGPPVTRRLFREHHVLPQTKREDLIVAGCSFSLVSDRVDPAVSRRDCSGLEGPRAWGPPLSPGAVSHGGNAISHGGKYSSCVPSPSDMNLPRT